MGTMTARQSWTDERLDDLVERTDAGFQQVDRRFEQVDQRFQQVDRRFEQTHAEIAALRRETRAEIAELREETRAGLAELRGEIKGLGEGLHVRLDGLQRVLITASFAAIFSLVSALVALLSMHGG